MSMSGVHARPFQLYGLIRAHTARVPRVPRWRLRAKCRVLPRPVHPRPDINIGLQRPSECPGKYPIEDIHTAAGVIHI